jgi:hypothetical protein
MQAQIEISTPGPTETSHLSLDEFTKQFTKYMLECGFFRARSKNELDSLKDKHSSLILSYKRIIGEVNQQIALDQNRLKDVAFYGEDGEALKSRITNQIARQNRYLEELKSALAKTESLKLLFSLNPDQLIEEAKKEKSSVLLILQTPELMAKIPNSEIEHINHQDSETIKSLATILAAREYAFETPGIYASLKQQLQSEADQLFIAEKENESIRNLLIKMNNYLDKKIEKALNEDKQPWAIGYFGSRYKLNKNAKEVSVPQGIYELKTHLDQLTKTPPSQILANIQTILHTKIEEAHDESIFQQFKRFVSSLFGYRRSQQTINEYEHLEQVCLGKVQA